MRIDRKTFFGAVRKEPFGGRLTNEQVRGMEVLLDVWERHYVQHDIRWLAYALATAYHETAHTMQPIYERGSRDYFRRYDPPRKVAKVLGNTKAGDGFKYRGRGFVQLTGKANYRMAGRKLNANLLRDPDLALEPEMAAHILYRGMIEGWFTGKKLADYIKPRGKADYVRARRIVNGLDRAKLIAGYARAFAKALKTAKTGEVAKPADAPKRRRLAGVIAALLAALAAVVTAFWDKLFGG